MEKRISKLENREKSIETKFYTPCDITRIFSVVKDNYLHRIWLKLLFAYGLTLSELVNIRVRDIDFENNIIKINSSKKMRHRTLPLPKCLYNELKRESNHKSPDDLLFKGRSKEGKIHLRTVQKIFEKLYHFTGMEVSVSKIRRTTAIHLLQCGWEEKSITQLLGHSHLRTTKKLIGSNRKFYLQVDFPIDKILENAA
ncbi:MAG: tyrosine-type recombinase/integrase [Leptospiraceae bacterium]|nr:tyrosine-type recombinase/integrase [Leptospiraceae bacterium]